MKKAVIPIAAAVGAIILFWWLWVSHFSDTARQPLNDTARQASDSDRGQGVDKSYPQISLKGRTQEEALKEWIDRVRQDRRAEWKTPITFYGKVIDQNGVPVSQANVHFQWTDLSVTGTSSIDKSSDENGTFSLSGVQGKRLTVAVSKPGYDLRPEDRIRSFEFSNPGDPIFYEPDQASPVIIRLRRKSPADALVRKSLDIAIPNDGQSQNVSLNDGSGSPAEIWIQAWKPWPPKPSSPHYDWKIRMTMANGGFLESYDDIPVEAPESGYNETIEFDMPATSNAWNTGLEKILYFVYGQPKKYGRLEFRTNGDSRYVFMNYLLNPTPGSRNLEFDPAKQVQAK